MRSSPQLCSFPSLFTHLSIWKRPQYRRACVNISSLFKIFLLQSFLLKSIVLLKTTLSKKQKRRGKPFHNTTMLKINHWYVVSSLRSCTRKRIYDVFPALLADPTAENQRELQASLSQYLQATFSQRLQTSLSQWLDSIHCCKLIER
jgi:hypothetical protein